MVTSLLPATQRALLRRLAVEQREKRIPSVIAGLARGGEAIWVDSRGWVGEQPPTSDTQYRIGSITKTFVAVLVLRLRDEGRLDLADRLDEHVPGTAVGQYSIAELLSHSTALSAESVGKWWERTPGQSVDTLLSTVDSRMVRPEPRHVFHYSNVGFALLGELAARLRGEDWFTALRREVLQPLGMSRTSLHPSSPHATGWAVHPWADVLLAEPAEDAGAMAPAGQLWSTVDDMLRWVWFLAGDTAEVLHPDTLTEMRTPCSIADGDEFSSGYGLGLDLLRHRGRRLAGHGGSMPGFLANVRADPADGTGVVFLANTTAGLTAELATELLDVLDEHEPWIPEPWRPAGLVPADVLDLAGHWYWGPAPHILRITSDGQLDLAPAGSFGRASRFRANPDGTWTGLDGYHRGETLRVGRAADGTATHLDLNTFLFTRTPYDAEAPVPGGVAGWGA